MATDIDNFYDGNGVPMRMVGLADCRLAGSVSSDDFLAIIDGMEMDVRRRIRAPRHGSSTSIATAWQVRWGGCRSRVFGDPRRPRHLLPSISGRALQLTNILRDLDEDAGIGRLYLPREVLHDGRHRLRPIPPLSSRTRIGTTCAQVVAKARQHFARAHRIMAACPRKTVRSPRLMASVYGAILAEAEFTRDSHRRDRA